MSNNYIHYPNRPNSPLFSFLPPERLLLLFLRFQIGFWHLESALPPHRPDYNTINTTQTNTRQAKNKCVQYNFRGTWVKWLQKSCSQFTGRNETKTKTTQPHISPSKSTQKNYRERGESRSRWLGSWGPGGVVVVVDKANRSSKHAPVFVFFP